MLMSVTRRPEPDDAPFQRAPGDRPADLFSAHCTELTAQRLVPERRLYVRGATGRFAYVVASGIVRFERVTVSGIRRITRVAGRGDLIGQEALLRQAYRDDAVACTPATLHRVPASLLEDEGWPPGRPCTALMGCWQQVLDASEGWSSEVTVGPARRRMLQLLARLDRHPEGDQLVWLPRRDQMADMLDIAIETCSRVLSTLRRECVLAFVPPRHARLDRGRLAEALRRSDL